MKNVQIDIQLTATKLQLRRLALLGVLIIIAAFLLYTALPEQSDWRDFFRPAALAMLRGDNPYSVQDFHNAPWSLLIAMPFALLPYDLGRFLWFVVGFLCFIYIASKLSNNHISILLFITSFPVFGCLSYGQLDWMALLAFVTPPHLSLIFAAIKPQIGIGVAVYWLWVAWGVGGIRLIAKWFAPVTFLLSASFLAYGFWFMTFAGKWENPANISLFPYLIPLGVYMLYTKRPYASKASGVFFAPYHTLYSLAAPLIPLLKYPRLMLVAWVIGWSFQIARLILWR